MMMMTETNHIVSLGSGRRPRSSPTGTRTGSRNSTRTSTQSV